MSALRHRAAIWTATVVGAACMLGCGAPGGLGVGEPAPDVSSPPQPKPLWPSWADAHRQGEAVADNASKAPAVLAGAPEIPREGSLREVDPLDIVCADPTVKHLAKLGWIEKPGKSGLRPPVFMDVTGNGMPELIVAADLPTGRSAVAVYAARDGKVVPILYGSGRRLSVEAAGADLILKGAASDGAEQTIRYRWDGRLMAAVSDVKAYPHPIGKSHSP